MFILIIQELILLDQDRRETQRNMIADSHEHNIKSCSDCITHIWLRTHAIVVVSYIAALIWALNMGVLWTHSHFEDNNIMVNEIIEIPNSYLSRSLSRIPTCMCGWFATHESAYLQLTTYHTQRYIIAGNYWLRKKVLLFLQICITC